MGLVDDDGVVLIEKAVALHLGEQDAVGHQLDGGGLRHAIVKADGVANGLPDFLVQFRGDAFSHGARCNTARLGMADEPRRPRPSSRQIFGIRVVLPEPVSPAMITTWLSRMASAISSLRAVTGGRRGRR